MMHIYMLMLFIKTIGQNINLKQQSLVSSKCVADDKRFCHVYMLTEFFYDPNLNSLTKDFKIDICFWYKTGNYH